MIHAGSHDDLAVSVGTAQERTSPATGSAHGVEPLSAREVYRAIMRQVAKECPELKMAVQ